MSTIFQNTAIAIPESIRRIIVEKGFVDQAINSSARETPMEYLFDVHAEFLDPAGEYQNFGCGKCRQHVLDLFKKLKPYL